ncbi:phosphoribosyltransferase family protein [Bacillota bacterium Lsc_1132]
MQTIQTSTCFKKKYSFPILDFFDVEVEVTNNPYILPLDELFTMAARMNKKRSFLFVSKLIGKHIPVHPNKALVTSALLAVRYYESKMGEEYCGKSALLAEFLKENPSFSRVPFIPAGDHPLIIGFAETATALGQAFFDCFRTAEYFHTTREVPDGWQPVITFEEEHSHATSHRCYVPLDMIQNQREIILVDDELTTGKTALNIIRSLHAQFPRKNYSVAAILDWRTDENKRDFAKLEQELGIKIHVASLLAGTVRIETHKAAAEEKAEIWTEVENGIKVERISVSSFFSQIQTPFIAEAKEIHPAPFIQETGRFGLHIEEARAITDKVNRAADYLAGKRSGKRTLCLGTGEFMYLPLRIAAKLGKGISFQSTTRSPIFVKDKEGYGARYKAVFPSPENQEITHYVYNIPNGFYDEIFVFFERETEEFNLEPMLNELKNTGVKSIKLVVFSEIQR